MLWIALALGLSLLGVAAQRAASPHARNGLLIALAALASLLLATRLGGRVLFVAAPTLAWMAWRWQRAAVSSGGRERAGEMPGTGGKMTREEALRVLGLREGASSEAITDAHRSLIKKVHPDHGGSDLLAQQVNEAKRVLERGDR